MLASTPTRVSSLLDRRRPESRVLSPSPTQEHLGLVSGVERCLRSRRLAHLMRCVRFARGTRVLAGEDAQRWRTFQIYGSCNPGTSPFSPRPLLAYRPWSRLASGCPGNLERLGPLPQSCSPESVVNDLLCSGVREMLLDVERSDKRPGAQAMQGSGRLDASARGGRARRSPKVRAGRSPARLMLM